MGYVTREMIDRAKKMDLLTYLQTYEPQELVHFGGNTYCTREHDSLKISNGKWCWFSRGIGGKTALDYLIKVKELPFTEAVERIVGRAAERPSVFHARAQPEKPKTLLLPPKSNSNTRVIAYLKSRGIDGGLIEQCIRSGQLYESLPYHNAVFVGMDRNGTPRYACLRGIGTDFKGEATGSDKRFSFALPATGESRMLCVFESAIDLLSYATMAQAGGLSWRSQHLLSLAGVYKPQKETQEHRLPLALTQYLKDHAEIKTICLCLDNDMTGRSATEAIRQQLAERYKVASAFPRQGKDYNDWLCIRIVRQTPGTAKCAAHKGSPGQPQTGRRTSGADPGVVRKAQSAAPGSASVRRYCRALRRDGGETESCPGGRTKTTTKGGTTA